MMKLRDYQEAAIRDIEQAFSNGHRRVLFTMPTGSGKTVVLAALAMRADLERSKLLIVVHRREILRQTEEHLLAAGLDGSKLGIIWGKHGERKDAPIQLASVQTLCARRKRVEGLSAVIVDEAHHSPTLFAPVLNDYPEARVLGATATPARLDGKPLGEWFDVLVEGPNVEQLIAERWLGAPTTWSHPKGDPDMTGVCHRGGDYDGKASGRRMSLLVGDIVSEWQKRAKGLRTACFAASVEHGSRIVGAFRKARIAAELLTGNVSDSGRLAIIGRLRSGETLVVVNCDVISEGFDMPEIRCVVMARPTMSENVVLQQSGRAMRPGSATVILDHAGNFTRQCHDLPSFAREWSLSTERVLPKVPRCITPEDRDEPCCRRPLEEFEGELAKLDAGVRRVFSRECAGFEGHCRSGKLAPIRALRPSLIRNRNGLPWICRSCSSRRALATRAPEQWWEALRKARAARNGKATQPEAGCKTVQKSGTD